MRILHIFKETLKKADFFKANDLLRYKAESQYRTVFGGVVSLLLIALLITAFYQRLLSCIKKDEVNSTEQTIINEIPSLYSIDTYPLGNFMMAISIRNLNISEIQRFFSISMDSIVSLWDYQNNKWNSTTNKVPLEKCTRAHWKLLSRMDTEYDSWDLDNMFCLPMSTTLEVQGDELSDTSKKLKIQVKPCQNNSVQPNTCADKSEIEQYLNSNDKFETRLYIINTNVNPSNKEYVQYIFNYKNILTFTSEQSSEGTIFVQDYEIETDQSILPIPMTKTDSGATFSTTIIPKIHRRINEMASYCQFNIFKSDLSKKYTRSFNKFDQNLAFIGGLFGMLSMVLVIVNSYNNFAYEISLGSALFKPEDQNQMSTFRKYNFCSFLLQIIYEILNTFGFSPEWKSTIEYNECQKEMEKQLDIQYILDRLTYLESAISTTLEDYQLKGLHLKGKLTLKEAREKRQAFKLKKEARQVQRTILKTFTCKETNSKNQTQSDSILPFKSGHTKTPTAFSLFASNLVSPVFPEIRQEQKEGSDCMKQNTVEQSMTSSSSESEQEEQNDTNKKVVVGILNRLRRDSQRGDKLSQKIWEITNSAFINNASDPKNNQDPIQESAHCQSANNLVKQNKFDDMKSQVESVSSDQVASVVNNLPNSNTKKNIIRPSRFSKLIQKKQFHNHENHHTDSFQPAKNQESQTQQVKKRRRPFLKRDYPPSKTFSIAENHLHQEQL